MAQPWAFITARPAPGYRGGLPGGPQDFRAQSLSANWSWGTEPATAELVYVGSGNAPVDAGDWMVIQAAGHTFHGNCVKANSVVASSGFRTTITFEDNRTYLKWDSVYCAFNMRDERIENGKRIKRYWHITPANYALQRRTYTNSPLTAAQILDQLFGASTVEDTWTRVYHADMNTYPVFELNWLNGTKLSSALNQISEELGVQFTLQGGAFRLVWSRRGEGTAPAFSGDSDNREVGKALSGHGTRIRVLGERNQYQVHDIPMVKDWKEGWEQYYHVSKFRDAVWEKTENVTVVTIGGRTWQPGEDKLINIAQTDEAKQHDPHQQITRQLASARASEITVAEFAELAQDPALLDDRSFNGKARNAMPAILYINQIVYRAFTFQSGFTIRNADGIGYRVVDAGISRKMVARVRHDATTGQMSWDTSETHDGPGFAVVQGYSVGQNLFRDINPDRFQLDDWNKAQDVWESIPIQVDDGSDDVPFILFDAPVIRSADLIKVIDGNAVLNAEPTITVPPVKCALTFDCEKFSFIKGTGTRDDFTHVPGLYGQHVGTHNANPTEVLFADGLSAQAKANQVASPLLGRQFSHTSGKSDRHVYPTNGVWAQGTQLNGAIDRVVLTISENGVKESVHLTSEAPRKTFVPERDLDRKVRDEGLFPGQKELRNDASIRRLTSAALQQSPEARQLLQDVFNQRFGTNAPGEQTMVAPDD